MHGLFTFALDHHRLVRCSNHFVVHKVAMHFLVVPRRVSLALRHYDHHKWHGSSLITSSAIQRLPQVQVD
jgi:hypothetical protein